MSVTEAFGMKHSKTNKFLILEEPEPHVNADFDENSRFRITFLTAPFVTVHQVSGNDSFNGEYLIMHDNGDLGHGPLGPKAEFLYSPAALNDNTFYLSKQLPGSSEVNYVAFKSSGLTVIRQEYNLDDGHFKYIFPTFRPAEEQKKIAEWWQNRDPSIDSKFTNWPNDSLKQLPVAADNKKNTESDEKELEKLLGSIQLDVSSEPELIGGTTE